MSSFKIETQQVDDEELQAAQKIIQAFVTVFKSYSLYPEDHVFCRTNLDKFKTQLQTFLERYEEFPLNIEKNTFIYQGSVIFDGPPEENNPAYLLTRDGLVKLNFLQGIDTVEIAQLLHIFNRHRTAGDESGGDIVTSLWQAEFQHIEYDEVDIFALESFSFDLGTLQVAQETKSPQTVMEDTPETIGHTEVEKGASEEAEPDADPAQSTAQSETITNLLQMEKAFKVLEVTPEEKALLESLVQEEEGKDHTNDVIDVLLIILISQKKNLHFNQVLEFLESVFFDTLDKGNFHLSYKICSNVLTIAKQIKSIRPWTGELVDSFFSSLSQKEPWEGISWVTNPHLLVLHQAQMNYLWQIIRLLSTDIIYTLGLLAGRIGMDNIHVRNELFELIENFVKKDPDKLGQLLAVSEENINLLLYPIVESISKIDAAKISLQMTRHDSVKVRRTGLNGYITYASFPDCSALYHLLSDDDAIIVEKLLSFFLTQVGNEETETILLRFLEKATVEGLEHAQMFEYYKTLSRCGSFRTVSLLGKILLESKFSDMFSNMNSVHKKGSALALKIIGSEEAMNILRKGSKSLRPDIRLACQFAMGKK